MIARVRQVDSSTTHAKHLARCRILLTFWRALRLRLFDFGMCGAFPTDSFQEGGRRFVIAPLAPGEFRFGNHEFAAKRAGEDGLSQLVDVRFRRAVAGFERVGGFEKFFDAADDFTLLFTRRQWNREAGDIFETKVRASNINFLTMHVLYKRRRI